MWADLLLLLLFFAKKNQILWWGDVGLSLTEDLDPLLLLLEGLWWDLFIDFSHVSRSVLLFLSCESDSRIRILI